MRIILAALVTLAAFPLLSAAQDRWHKVTDQEAGFTISFPGRPTYEQSADPTLLHQTEKYKFFYSRHLLQIIFAPLDRPVHSPTELSDAFSEITRVQAGDGTLLRQVKLPDEGRQYDNVTRDENGTAFHRTRVYIRHGRYYAISYSIYATGGLDEREAARFFSSFKFTNHTSINRGPIRRGDLGVRGNVDHAEGLEWYRLNSPEGEFVVDFPGKPEYREFPNTETGIPDRKYYYHYGENTFIVSFREEPAAVRQPDEVLRRTLERELTNSDGWRVLQHKHLRDGGHYVESQGTVDGIPILMLTKLYLYGTRLYHVTTMTQNLTGPNKEDVARFLSSFHLL
jgi:hypothetical protein